MPKKVVKTKDLATHKALTAVAVTSVTLVTLAGFIFPGDIFFWFISSNIVVEITRLALLAMLVWISLIGKFPSKQTRKTYQLVGAGLIAFSFLGIAVPQIGYDLFSYVKPLDYIVGLELGVLLLMSTVLYPAKRSRKAATVRNLPALPKIRLWALDYWRLRHI